MRGRAPPDEVDRSRAGHLVHDAQQEGRGLELVVYIEGLQGDTSRSYVREHIMCRTADQSGAMAKLLREARRPPDCSQDHNVERTCERGTRWCTINHTEFESALRGEAMVAAREVVAKGCEGWPDARLLELAEMRASYDAIDVARLATEVMRARRVLASKPQFKPYGIWESRSSREGWLMHEVPRSFATEAEAEEYVSNCDDKDGRVSYEVRFLPIQPGERREGVDADGNEIVVEMAPDGRSGRASFTPSTTPPLVQEAERAVSERYGVWMTIQSWGSIDGGTDWVGSREQAEERARTWREDAMQPSGVQYEIRPYTGDAEPIATLAPAVHVLLHGLPLCDFSRDLPRLWPTGHKWVSVEDVHLATCPRCVATVPRYAGG